VIDLGCGARFGIISRMKRHAGFTWIELVLILAVIGILGAMAIPGIQDSMLKKQVKEGLALAGVAKSGVQAYWSANGDMPASNAVAGIPAKDKIVGSMVKEVAVENGAIHIVYGNNASRALTGLKVTIRPAVVKDEPSVPIAWLCAKLGVPDKMEVKGQDLTDIPAKWLPIECRGPAKP
jgi:type IV pilus assembly protein PilA